MRASGINREVGERVIVGAFPVFSGMVGLGLPGGVLADPLYFIPATGDGAYPVVFGGVTTAWPGPDAIACIAAMDSCKVAPSLAIINPENAS